MKNITAAVAVLIVLTCAPHTPRAQGRASTGRELQALREEIRKLKEEQGEMRKDLQAIKQLLERVTAGQPPAPAKPEFVSVDDDPSQGAPTAKVVLIDFSDYQ